VKVDVFNSANIHVKSGRSLDGSLVVGRRIDEGELTVDAPDAALMSEIVKGSLGRNAEVSINIDNSANVRMEGRSTELWIGKGTLLQEIANVDPAQYVRDVCIGVTVANSANVDDVSGGAKIFIRDGQLDDETIDLPSYCSVGVVSRPCLGNDGRTDGSLVVMSKRNVANIRGALDLSTWDGELSDESVDIGELTNSNINLNMENVGNAQGSYCADMPC
jgi:hypothetical protein